MSEPTVVVVSDGGDSDETPAVPVEVAVEQAQEIGRLEAENEAQAEEIAELEQETAEQIETLTEAVETAQATAGLALEVAIVAPEVAAEPEPEPEPEIEIEPIAETAIPEDDEIKPKSATHWYSRPWSEWFGGGK